MRMKTWLCPLLGFVALLVQGCTVEVNITSPADNTTVVQGTVVPLSGEGAGPGDNVLLGGQLQWLLDGSPLGSGEQLQLDTAPLASGPHTVTLFTDVDPQNRVEHAITLNITLPPLDVVIFSPVAGSVFDQSDTVSFTGEAIVSGRSTVVPSENLRWFIDDIFIGPNSPFSFQLFSFSPGPHTVRLEATLVDQNEETLRGSASIQIVIRSGIDWQETYGRLFQDQAFLNGVTRTNTGEGDKQSEVAYVSGGSFFPATGGGDALALFYDADGQLLDDRLYGGDDIDHFFDVLALDDGLLFAGSTRSFGAGFIDAYLVRTDATGDVAWEMHYGGSGAEDAQAVVPTGDGGAVFVGSISSAPAQFVDLYLVKVDAEGNVVWDENFGGAATDQGYGLVATSDGGYVAAGVTNSGSADDDFYVVKTDGEGTLVWETTFGVAGAAEEAKAVIETGGGGLLVVGIDDPDGSGQSDIYVVKTDSDGNLEWDETYGGAGRDVANAALEAEDGTYIIAGTTDSTGNGSDDFYMLKLDTEGAVLAERTFGGSGDDEALGLDFGADTGYIVCGTTESFGSSEISGYLVKTDQDLNSPYAPE